MREPDAIPNADRNSHADSNRDPLCNCDANTTTDANTQSHGYTCAYPGSGDEYLDPIASRNRRQNHDRRIYRHR